MVGSIRVKLRMGDRGGLVSVVVLVVDMCQTFAMVRGREGVLRG